jgi:hypothetical protein
MQLYSYILDLRIWHPTIDPDLVSRTLGLEPQTSWRAGDSCKTPKGTLLEGVRSEGYWSTNPFSYGWRESTDAQIEDALEELVTFLEPHRVFLRGISQGGTVRIWVSSQGNRNFAFELTPSMLARLASLGATFVHDVYQGP